MSVCEYENVKYAVPPPPTAQSIVDSRKKHQQELIAMIKEQEVFAKQNPAGYRSRVKRMAWLGYGYIFGVLIGTFLLIAGVIWLAITAHFSGGIAKLVLLLGIFALAILRSLWVRLMPPAGVELKRGDAPRLFEEIDNISKSLDSIKVEKLLIDGDVNASAIQLPRFGAFGPVRNYLTIGMPLLLCLTPDEFRFVVAHEFGHFSGKHGKFGAWIYRLNRTWANLQENVGSHAGAWVLSSFFSWFEPRFAATTFVLRREQEYEADKVAIGLTSPMAGADALMRLHYIEPHLQKHFWEPLAERVKTDPTPPADALVQMSVVAGGSVGPEFIKERLAVAFRSQTDYDDTHPSLTDRLRAMGLDGGASLARYSTDLSKELSETAAGRFLGQHQRPVLERVSGELTRNLTGNWTQAHQEYREQVRRLE